MIKNSLDAILKQQAEKILNKKTPKKNLIYTFNNLTIDISRHLIDEEVLKNLLAFSKSINIKSKINQLFNNKYKSQSENKKVSFLYERSDKNLKKKNINKLFELHDLIKNGKWQNSSDKDFKYVVHIGIGGSILGPKATSHALKDYHDKQLQVYYASSADTSEIDDILEKCVLDETLFIFASKSFETKEVLINYTHIKNKLSNALYGWVFSAPQKKLKSEIQQTPLSQALFGPSRTTMMLKNQFSMQNPQIENKKKTINKNI